MSARSRTRSKATLSQTYSDRSAPWTSQRDALFTETIRKSEKYTSTQRDFVITPSISKYVIIGQNPQHTREVNVEEKYVKAITPHARRGTSPQTTSQEYGWDTRPLLKERCPFTHHPRHATDISRLYGPFSLLALRTRGPVGMAR